MLQIKKKAMLINCKYNLLFLFRRRGVESLYPVQKQKTTSVTLRSPKHFNIGKYKITNLNFKTPDLFYRSNSKFFLPSLIVSPEILYKLLTKRVQSTPALSVNSIKLSIKTSFKLMWLVI